MKNPYDILGVDKKASADEIKKAYRRMANKHHPDKGGDEEKFKEINEAYQILSDEKKRQAYDQFGAAGMGAGGFGGGGFQGGGGFEDIFGGSGGFSDIFESFFTGSRPSNQNPNRNQRGEDIEMTVEIDFMEAVTGIEKTIAITKTYPCETCDASGAQPGSSIVTCDECQGSGQVRRVQQTILGSIATSSPCSKCGGEGKIPEKKCQTCHGEGRVRKSDNITFKIPAGIDNGMNIRMSGYGEAGRRGSPAGDLYLNVRVKPDKRFVRQGNDIVSEMHITIPQAVLGDTVSVETIYGEVSVKIPHGISSGQILKIKDKGMAKVQSSGNGDHLIHIIVDIPKHLSSKEKELYESLRDEKHGSVKKKRFF